MYDSQHVRLINAIRSAASRLEKLYAKANTVASKRPGTPNLAAQPKPNELMCQPRITWQKAPAHPRQADATKLLFPLCAPGPSNGAVPSSAFFTPEGQVMVRNFTDKYNQDEPLAKAEYTVLASFELDYLKQLQDNLNALLEVVVEYKRRYCQPWLIDLMLKHSA